MQGFLASGGQTREVEIQLGRMLGTLGTGAPGAGPAPGSARPGR